MIVFAIVVTLMLGGGLFVIYRGFEIITEDFKLTRLLLQAQQKEMIGTIESLGTNLVMILGSELGDNLKKFIKLKGKGNMVIRSGRVVKEDVDY
jgi:hypothetical protein